MQCEALGNIVDGQVIWKKEHNHDVDPTESIKHEFKAKLKTAVISSLRGFRNIYDDIAKT